MVYICMHLNHKVVQTKIFAPGEQEWQGFGPLTPKGDVGAISLYSISKTLRL